MEKHLDGPIPSVSEAIRKLDKGSQDVAGIAGNGEGDHREWKCDRHSYRSVFSRTEPE
ncbi:hypothetical protein KSX_75620 [Ktedonospora formicarum]|nr:hypothetical protein KSX_37530 [Ktedonospora formicarum]GHO47000.1 hypothetical protein KSX_51630 [Ktedonospora formicarum]GHO49399.1 hypothetical protein KSX_75620 [Ktedonospora formicarum]